jgi:hypothetical protein
MLLRRVACLYAVLHLISTTTAGVVEIVSDSPVELPRVASITALTHGPRQHFVGYYGITPWNSDGTRLFCLQTDVIERLVNSRDVAQICLIDPASGQVEPLTLTRAWNLQQGAMLHWIPTPDGHEAMLFNDRGRDHLVSQVIDFKSKTSRTIDRPVAAVAPDGRTAVGIDYDRLRRIRPVTGYAGGDMKSPLTLRPTDNGLFLIDLVSGKTRLLVSIEKVCRAFPPPAALEKQPIWLEHAMFSRKGTQLFLIARALDPNSHQLTSIPLVMRPDGSNLRALLPWAIQGASHFDWLDDRRLTITREDRPGKWGHLLIDVDDAKATPKPLAPKILTRDGHCTFSPDRRWMVTDTYPDKDRRQHLFIYDVRTDHAARIASFHEPEKFKGDWRCDLHPRWSRDSKQICIDSTHEGTRQVYVIDLKMPEEPK